jgi:dUTP pyrophosphatase
MTKMIEMISVMVETLSHYDENYPLPSYETLGAAGMDIRAQLGGDGETLVIPPFARTLIPTGIKVAIPAGYEIQVRPRSGLSLKTSLLVVNSPGTIDADYRGEIKIILGNLGKNDEVIKHGDRIAQLVLAQVPHIVWKRVEKLDQTERGAGGFGSTGQS